MPVHRSLFQDWTWYLAAGRVGSRKSTDGAPHGDQTQALVLALRVCAT
jgi:hypothetical protein